LATLGNGGGGIYTNPGGNVVGKMLEHTR
jgi:hypothetical protein